VGHTNCGTALAIVKIERRCEQFWRRNQFRRFLAVLDELVRTCYPLQPHRKILAMISVYVDESGIHDSAQVCLVAGYFGKPNAWANFEKRWRKILAAAGVALEDFHALDLIEHRRAFFGMDRKKHQKLIHDLAKAVAKFRIYPVAYGLILADFHVLPELQKRFFTGATIDDREKPGKLITDGCQSKPYFMPFLHFVKQTLSHTPVDAKAHFYFGLDRPFYRYATEMFKMIQERPDKEYSAKLGDAHLPQAKHTPQLQAADFLSYTTYRHMLERHAANEWRVPPAEPLKTLLTNKITPYDFVYFNHETIAEALQATYTRAGNWDGHATGGQ